MKEVFDSFGNSLGRLEEIIEKEKTVANCDSAIKRFEFTVELAWKCLQWFLGNEGIVCNSPKECLREAFKFGLIKDDPKWIEMLRDRNLAVHTYNEKTADEVYGRLPEYTIFLKSLKKNWPLRAISSVG